ncbi:MAG: hypothetical protein CL581_09755 [Alteromonadaceae bacterium]|nr:hypothetical protein [Alteromonadaceae bacterium]MBH86154.1 hypothetical protein [Alteromonadaceae bacterium]|tara:strand:- start:66 stop:437 length:372 start_codon:yes stop_codon:yes gene_type:complete
MKKDATTRATGQISEAEIICSELAVSAGDYHKAIELLWSQSAIDDAKASVASRILLGAYDPTNWGITFCDLGSLDYPLLKAALIVIRGRLVLGIEPHTVISNGPARFRQLIERSYPRHLKIAQ